jgi:hypothetical protein
VSLDVQAEEGGGHFEGAGGFIGSVATHQAFTIAAGAMGVDSQQLALKMAAGTTQPTQVFLKGFGFRHAMGFEQIMDGLIGGDKGKPVEQLETLLAQATGLANAGVS